MKTLFFIALLASSLSAISASEISENCENKVMNSAEKMISSTDEITDIQAMEDNHFVITYYMYDRCYGSIYVKIAPEKEQNDVASACEIISMEEPYWPRCE